jgi:hypothetical protein
MPVAVTASATGTSTDGPSSAGAGAAATPAGPGDEVGGSGETSAAESTSRPTPAVAGGVAKPQSSSSAAWSAARSGTLSVPITLTTSRRPSRSAAVTKVCRAASVNPVLPPRLPGVPASGFWLSIWKPG